ncbi:MAG: hypothetical protein NC395_04795 [Prevotella sp.]|nr:hypothetical protein [Prevotella sp.]
MLKIVKGYGYGYVPAYSVGEPVKIDNTVYLPGEDEETGEVISAEEQRRRAEEEKAEEERRFSEAVDAKVSQILAERSAALEQERAQVIEAGKNEAASISAKAKADTMAIMEKAKRECAMLKEQARKEGYDEGFANGREESLDKYSKYIDASGRLLEEINSRKEAYYISAEEEMRNTVFELVNKIVRTELRTNPQVLNGIIAEAAKNFRNSDYIKITLAEDGITERFRTDEKLIKDIIPFIPEVELEFDEDAEEGTVIEDNGSEIVDAGIPTQLEFLKEIMRTTRGGDSGDISEAFEIASDSVMGESLAQSAEKGETEAVTVEIPEIPQAAVGQDVPVTEAAAEPETVPEPEIIPEAETTQTQEEAPTEEEAPAQVNFADIMADVMSESQAAETDKSEDSELTEEDAARLMAELMAEAEAAASAATAGAETAGAAEQEEASKTPKPGKKSKPRKSAAENAE